MKSSVGADLTVVVGTTTSMEATIETARQLASRDAVLVRAIFEDPP
jgi:hypothetical protein